MEEIDRSDPEARRNFLQNCLSHRDAILKWYDESQHYLCGPPILCEPGEMPSQLPPSEHLFGTPYRFISIDHARIHTRYWTMLSFMAILIYQAKALDKDLSSIDPTEGEEFRLSALYAGEICRTLPYLFQPNMRLVGAWAAITAIPVASRPFIHLRDAERFNWCQDVSSCLADLGLHVPSQLARTAFGYWSLCEDPDTNAILSLSLRWSSGEGTAEDK